ncbi:MAG: L-seryl-tRNA(Sec) selenium transferase [Planctomycetota bacterium]|jgi:L-seryl-tRNA(Ser) seleniumtransferase|nr:L-seryl-tRNA(Sec) selenium transferase [Planctomycetota bacterium]MDP6839731.1 L-seryl-tRNA(Sec) selenium transferase [Planctomycetota bacterium]
MTDKDESIRSAYRLLPAVDEVLREKALAALTAEVGRGLLRACVQEVIDLWRTEVAAGELNSDQLATRVAAGDAAREAAALVELDRARGLVPVVNATGVVLHTGLGRAPVHPEAAAAMAQAAASFCVLEVDRFTGARNRRDDRLSELLLRLTGAEAAIAVNNNAAAVFLCLSTFAAGKQAIVSRGELVEIGGSFRVPDVMAQAGAHLVEVGTTNRTRIADYAAALGEQSGLLLKVHTSNFRLVGFTEDVEARELAELGESSGVTSAYDLGSGLIDGEGGGDGDGEDGGCASLDMLEGEPLVRAAVASGVDVVTFSGDKLLGGPQAGLIVGRRPAIEALRANAVYRALRLDKAALAGLEATLDLYLTGRGDELPAREMLLRDGPGLALAAQELAGTLRAMEGLEARVVPGQSEPGSGSAPGIYIDTSLVEVARAGLSSAALAAALRAGNPPVFARIHDDALLLDMRTLLAGDHGRLVTAFEAL